MNVCVCEFTCDIQMNKWNYGKKNHLSMGMNICIIFLSIILIFFFIRTGKVGRTSSYGYNFL